MSDISNNNNEDIKRIHTYYTYYTYSQLKDVQASERRQHFTTSYSPTIHRLFCEAVHRSQPHYVKPNRVLEDFKIDYILKNLEDQRQPKLTQFFIKADQVNIAKKQVIVKKPEPKPIDYSKLNLEELQKHYTLARKLKQQGKMNSCAFELKRRGIRL